MFTTNYVLGYNEVRLISQVSRALKFNINLWYNYPKVKLYKRIY